MLTILVSVGAIIMTVLAFALKETVFRVPMLHGAAVLIWLVTTVLLVVNAVANYPGTVVPEGIAVFGMTMIIIHTVSILMPYLRSRKGESEVYNERQSLYKARMAQMFRRRTKMWWE